VLGLLGYALIANYLAIYLLFPICAASLYLIVLLEERELRDRFGAAYQAYARRVPRFIPRIRPFG
jgi:protein-S-isoprenylcysteine O-methyltransferase Ste14